MIAGAITEATDSVSSAENNDNVKDAPQAVQPPSRSEDATQVDDKRSETNEKDSRLYGEPGERENGENEKDILIY